MRRLAEQRYFRALKDIERLLFVMHPDCGNLHGQCSVCRVVKDTLSNSRRGHAVRRILEFNGTVDTESGWARRIGISQQSLYWRLTNWPLDKALSTPKVDRNAVG